jgi:hypothetical protein
MDTLSFDPLLPPSGGQMIARATALDDDHLVSSIHRPTPDDIGST